MRTYLGALHDQGERPFVSERVFVWDGATLLGETGLNHLHQPIWRATYVPGPAAADSPQVHIEEVGSINQSLALVRDELGSVIAIAEDRAPISVFPLRARIFYSPLGEAHLETGLLPASGKAGGAPAGLCPSADYAPRSVSSNAASLVRSSSVS